MNLPEYRKVYQEFSGEASKLARQLGFAGLAIIWIFRNENLGKVIPASLVSPGLLIVVGLACDLLQYVWATAVWGGYQQLLERRGTPESEELDAPGWFNWPTLAFFWGKLVAIVVAYGLLIGFLIRHCL